MHKGIMLAERSQYARTHRPDRFDNVPGNIDCIVSPAIELLVAEEYLHPQVYFCGFICGMLVSLVSIYW